MAELGWEKDGTGDVTGRGSKFGMQRVRVEHPRSHFPSQDCGRGSFLFLFQTALLQTNALYMQPEGAAGEIHLSV